MQFVTSVDKRRRVFSSHVKFAGLIHATMTRGRAMVGAVDGAQQELFHARTYSATATSLASMDSPQTTSKLKRQSLCDRLTLLMISPACRTFASSQEVGRNKDTCGLQLTTRPRPLEEDEGEPGKSNPSVLVRHLQ